MAIHRREDVKHKMRSAERKADVARDMVRLGGRTEAGLVADRDRGAGSPLGKRKEPEGRRRS
jgi:hypothetical protein